MNPIRSWNRLFFGPISARPLGVFRIVFGVLMLLYLGLMTVEFDLWYTGAGLLQAPESRVAAGPFGFLRFNTPITRRSPAPCWLPRRRRRWD